jgi:hypothetical protein
LSGAPEQGEELKRLEVHVSPKLLAAASREADLWGVSLEDLVRASIAGSLAITRAEKQLFAHMIGLLGRVGDRLAVMATGSPPAGPDDTQGLSEPIKRLVLKGDRVPLLRALREVQDLPRVLSSFKGGTPAQREAVREALLTARRAGRVAARLLAGEQPRTDLLGDVLTLLYAVAECLG